jgi:hypothetical protein
MRGLLPEEIFAEYGLFEICMPFPAFTQAFGPLMRVKPTFTKYGLKCCAALCHVRSHTLHRHVFTRLHFMLPNR